MSTISNIYLFEVGNETFRFQMKGVQAICLLLPFEKVKIDSMTPIEKNIWDQKLLIAQTQLENIIAKNN